MISQAILGNAYTNSPKQQPNLILGSLQLLFWLFFRPSAWRNHVARINTTLHPDSDSANYCQWRNPAFWRLLIQAYLVLPILVNLPLILVQWGLAELGTNIAFRVEFNVLLSAVFGVALGLTLAVRSSNAFGVVFFLAGSVTFILARDTTLPDMDMSVMFTLVRSVTHKMTVSATPDTITSVISDVTRFLIGVIATISTFFIVYGGYLLITDDGSGGNVKKGREIVIKAIIGLIIGLTASTIVELVRSLLEKEGSGLLSDTVAPNAVFILARFLIFISGLLSFLFIVYGGFLFIVSNGNEQGAETGKKILINATVSLIVSLIAYTIVEVVEGLLKGTIPNVVPGVVFSLGVTLNLWRPVLLYPFLVGWNTLLYQFDKRRTSSRLSLLRYNSAFWDEFQLLPLLGLDKHIVLVAESNPGEGYAAMKYLSTSHQQWAAWTAQVEIDAPKLESCADVEALRKAHFKLATDELKSPVSALLRSFSSISEDVNAALNQESAYNQRLALKAVADRLNCLLSELSRRSDTYAARFYPIATSWRKVVADYVDELTEAVELRQEIDSPYIVGVPLTEQQEIFVGRTDVSLCVEQLLLDRRRPPLLLYGQRRMGKTSLLNNLGRLLPNTIIPMFVDLQGPASRASDHVGFLYNIARAMKNSAQRQGGLTLPALTREALVIDPFTCFDEWLDEVEQLLKGNIALLALDEFEALDSALAEGRFSETVVLGMLRHLIQHRPNFKVLLSGSHTLEEFQRWASYLINVQVVHISYLNEAEARLLIERPVKDFALRYELEAVARVLDLTRCHPFLVQLLCAEIVALKNEQDPAVRRLATVADVEAAVPKALSSGSFFFADIERNQVDTVGLAILHFLAAQGEGAIVSQKALSRQVSEPLDSTLNLLLRRELIEPVGEGYRFQVELIRRWFV
jgi:hypothetical protein